MGNGVTLFRFLIVFLFAGLLSTQSVQSQVTDAEKPLRTQRVDTLGGWNKGGLVNLNFSQSSFTYWSAGGQNAVGLNGLVSLFANYDKGSNTWDNLFDLGYGVLRQGKGRDFIKTDDKIDLFSKYGRKASAHWYYSALVNFKTQLRPGYDYPNDSVSISKFLAPAYLIAAAGMDYKPSSHFTAFFSPITSRITVVNDQRLADAGAYGVKPAVINNGIVVNPGSKSRSEFGGYIRMMYTNTLFSDKSVSLLTKLDLFSNYLNEPEAVDVSWETILGFKINKFMSATLTTHLLYDKDIKIALDKNGDGLLDAPEAKVQFKQVLGIGFSYQF
jgi:hypothetical protein